jgi:hypothetical protein
VFALLVSGAFAQSRMGWGHAGSGHLSAGRMGFAHAHRPFSSRYGYYGLPFWYSDYSEPYDLEYAPPELPPPPAPAVQLKVEPVPDAVLLELHGTQWVRVRNFGEASDHALATETPVAQETSEKPLPPAILVFRDGHTEEVASYSIISGTIYAKADYWSTGAWTRTIPVSDLNVSATLAQNQERGVKFELPSSPGEVMLRP